MSLNCKQLDVEVTRLDLGMIRLKFHGVINDNGPDLIIDEAMARQIIAKLKAELPDVK